MGIFCLSINPSDNHHAGFCCVVLYQNAVMTNWIVQGLGIVNDAGQFLLYFHHPYVVCRIAAYNTNALRHVKCGSC